MPDSSTPEPQGATLRQAWIIQRRVIGALMLREILTRYGRHNIGFLWLFAEPMLFTLGVTALWTATKSVHGSNLPIVAFAVTGYSSVLLWRNMPARCIGAIAPNLSLLYHRNVRPIDIYLSRVLLEAAGATMSFVFLVLFFNFIGWLAMPEDALQIAGAWLMLAWFGASAALLLGALSEVSETVEKLWHPASYILFPLSGAAFLVDSLPKAAQDVVLTLPMVHGVEMLREGYFGSQIVAHYDTAYMALINTVLTILGLAQVSKISRTVVPE
ncbi:ABC transporter permease [Sphingomonas ginkgonis]|uniref:ABC transporter permease n=1 Tax=Sphingomonas ginkgonis TaxID=2315330 RepID=A0A429V8Y2_9SPHN|nr:ABC transporter permease [Sphingomonas ginkgonis]RST30384.1 ABC transporter permease [Sphingomonas ginkgonis]